MERNLALDFDYAKVKGGLSAAKGMKTLHQLLELMQIEERARVCLSRDEAQRCIQRAEKVRQQLWGSPLAVHFTTSHP